MTLRRTLSGIIRPLLGTPSLIRNVAFARSIKLRTDHLSVCYLSPRFPHPPPNRNEPGRGGEVKLTYLQEYFPHSAQQASVAYLVSGMLPTGAKQIISILKGNGVKLVVNQDGLYYKAWYGPGWERRNEELRWLHDQADHVIYQSEFCAQGAEHFFGYRARSHSIVLNPSDTAAFTQLTTRGPQPRLITLAAWRERFYRIDFALRVLKDLQKVHPQATLSVAGCGTDATAQEGVRRTNALAAQLGIASNSIEYLPTFTRTDAASTLSRGNLLLHTALNDPCPNVVAEALSLGMPVAYLGSGGVPELVGESAGIGVPTQLSWQEYLLPDPKELSLAVQQIWDNWDQYHLAARRRAVEALSLEAFIAKHRQIFEQLFQSTPRS